jgi:hypothetical protein
MRQFSCVRIDCNNIMYSDSDPQDICSWCNDMMKLGMEENQ